MGIKNELQKKKDLEKSNTYKKYIGKSVEFFNRNLNFLLQNVNILHTLFFTYTRNTKSKSISFGHALRSGTHPLKFR